MRLVLFPLDPFLSSGSEQVPSPSLFCDKGFRFNFIPLPFIVIAIVVFGS